MNVLMKMLHQNQNKSAVAAVTSFPKQSLFSFIEQRNEEKCSNRCYYSKKTIFKKK